MLMGEKLQKVLEGERLIASLENSLVRSVNDDLPQRERDRARAVLAASRIGLRKMIQDLAGRAYQNPPTVEADISKAGVKQLKSQVFRLEKQLARSEERLKVAERTAQQSAARARAAVKEMANDERQAIRHQQTQIKRLQAEANLLSSKKEAHAQFERGYSRGENRVLDRLRIGLCPEVECGMLLDGVQTHFEQFHPNQTRGRSANPRKSQR
jgi:hypothetical protein